MFYSYDAAERAHQPARSSYVRRLRLSIRALRSEMDELTAILRTQATALNALGLRISMLEGLVGIRGVQGNLLTVSGDGAKEVEIAGNPECCFVRQARGPCRICEEARNTVPHD
jgi:uncharacterized protein YlxW (UPF0749 family)